MTVCTQPQLAEALGAFALGACPPEEAAVLSDHLRSCTACRRELEQLEAGRERLLLGVAARPAPTTLKASVMATVHREAELFGAAQTHSQPAAAQRRWARWRERLRLPVPAFAVAAVLLIGLVLAGSLVDRSAAPQRSAERVVAGNVDSERAAGGSARMRVRDGHATLELRKFPSAGSGRQYQVWLRARTGDPRPTEVRFDVDTAGAAAVRLPLLAADEQVLVTSEPAGGSTRPTRPPVLSVDA